jgi:hypothetical protein
MVEKISYDEPSTLEENKGFYFQIGWPVQQVFKFFVNNLINLKRNIRVEIFIFWEREGFF